MKPHGPVVLALSGDATQGAAVLHVCTMAALSGHFFSTFQRKVTGATITPDKFDR